MTSVLAQSLPIKPRQFITAPVYTKFLAVALDHRHNNCLLWTLEDGDNKSESVEIIMLRLNDALDPVNAKYIGNFKDNAGIVHVFALRESERNILRAVAPAAEAKK